MLHKHLEIVYPSFALEVADPMQSQAHVGQSISRPPPVERPHELVPEVMVLKEVFDSIHVDEAGQASSQELIDALVRAFAGGGRASAPAYLQRMFREIGSHPQLDWAAFVEICGFQLGEAPCATPVSGGSWIPRLCPGPEP